MPNVKLLLLITQSAWGGAQKYVYDLATNLPKSYDIAVGVGTGGELVPKLKKARVKVIEIPELVRPINPVKDIQALLKIYRIIRNGNFQIVHTNSSKAGVLGRVAAKLAGAKVITYTIHGLVLNEPLDPLTKVVYWLMEKIGSVFSDAIIAVSQKDKDSATNYFLKGTSKIEVIPIGVRKFTAPRPSHHGLVIGTVANFYPTKGYRYYLPAIRKVVRLYPEVKFVLVGFSGPDEDYVKGKVKKLDLSQSVDIFTDKEGARKRMPGFDIFVLPSVKEGMPYTIIEAMQVGLPIVATNVGGIPEEITEGRSGLLVPPKDSSALATAIIRLIEDGKLRSKLGKNAKTDSEKFTLEKMVSATDRFYRRLLG